MLRRVSLAAVWLVTGMSACSNDFEPASHVTKLRLLAVRAEPAFAQPGEHVKLTTLLADPQARSLQWAFGTCTNPQASTVSGCIDALDGPLAASPPGADGFGIDVPEDALASVSDRARNGAAIGAVLVACPGEVGSGDTGGVPIACELEGRALGLEAFEVGVKRVFIREHDRNQNPVVVSVRWDGEDWPAEMIPEVGACDEAKDELEDCPKELQHRIDVETSEPERGQDEQGSDFKEQLIVQYYASEGVFEHEVEVADKAHNRWAAQGGSGERLATLWLVVRDDRGGVNWTSRTVRVR